MVVTSKSNKLKAHQGVDRSRNPGERLMVVREQSNKQSKGGAMRVEAGHTTARPATPELRESNKCSRKIL